MNTKEKAAWLADMYQHVADGGKLEYCDTLKHWKRATVESPSMGSTIDRWRKKPMTQVVDLSVLIESRIDCEFLCQETGDPVDIGKLLAINMSSSWPYQGPHEYFDQCRPRMNHIHAWQGGECPLPEGVRVLVYLRSGEYHAGEATEYQWKRKIEGWTCDTDIIQFEVLPELVGDWVWPWEVES